MPYTQRRFISACLVSIGCLATPVAAQPDSQRPSWPRLQSTQSFIDAMALPSEQQDSSTKQAVIQLTTSAVPKSEDASRLALEYVVKGPGLDARDGWTVTALFRLAISVPTFANARDLVWEVRIYRMPGEIVRVLWVSTSTKSVREVFPG